MSCSLRATHFSIIAIKYIFLTLLSASVLVSLTGSWRVPIFVLMVTLIIVGSQEKPPVPGRGDDLHTFIVRLLFSSFFSLLYCTHYSNPKPNPYLSLTFTKLLQPLSLTIICFRCLFTTFSKLLGLALSYLWTELFLVSCFHLFTVFVLS